MKFLIYPALLGLLLTSCGPALRSRQETIATAWQYSEVCWQPETRHVFHGKDSQGIQVHTPDVSLQAHQLRNGWWKPGHPAKGMPYQWGGFDTPESFRRSLLEGKFAGDISTPTKRQLGDHAVSRSACGIDCSGFISRCWNLPRPYSTQELPQICDPLPSYDDLKPGDILLNDRHVILFRGWRTPGKVLYAYEAGPFPVWRVNPAAMNRKPLEALHYKPWRYRHIID